MTLREQLEQQARAYLAVVAAKKTMDDAEVSLSTAERQRSRSVKPLTVIVDGKAVTSYKGIEETEFTYTVSEVVD